jgi:hypothetical protein
MSWSFLSHMQPILQNRRREGKGTWIGSYRCAFRIQGSMTLTPDGAKSTTLRVTMVMPCTSAVAAM